MKRDVIFTVADPKYFNRYAVPILVSAIENSMHLHLGILNPDDKSKALLSFIADYVCVNKAEHLVTFAVEETDLPIYYDKAVWAACGRLRHAVRYFENMPYDKDDHLYLLDLDSIILEHFTFPQTPLALVIDPLRENGTPVVWWDAWRDNGSKILMSGFFNKKTLPLLKDAVSFCERLHYGRWMLDQMALKHALDLPNNSDLARGIYNFYGTRYLNYGPWDTGAFVWTGKYNTLDPHHHFRKKAAEKYEKFLSTILSLPHNDELGLRGLLSLIGRETDSPFGGT